MSRKIAWVVLLVAGLIISVCGMAGAKVEGTKHDFSLNNDGGTNFGGSNLELSNGYPVEEICVFCHTPHSAAPTAATGVQGLLWNRSNSTATSYTMYTSSTLTSTIDMGTAPTGLTLMCMSCHDGITSIAVGTLINAPYSQGDRRQVNLVGAYGTIGELYKNDWLIPGWGANIGNLVPGAGGTVANLSDDHPVSFTWVNGITGIKDPALWGAAPLKLFNNRMECSTCHDVHNNTNEPFLRMSNVNSDMCTTCHIK